MAEIGEHKKYAVQHSLRENPKTRILRGKRLEEEIMQAMPGSDGWAEVYGVRGHV